MLLPLSIFHIAVSIIPHNPHQNSRFCPCVTWLWLCNFQCASAVAPWYTHTLKAWHTDFSSAGILASISNLANTMHPPIFHSNLASACRCFKVYPITWAWEEGVLVLVLHLLLYMSQFTGSLKCSWLFFGGWEASERMRSLQYFNIIYSLYL